MCQGLEFYGWDLGNHIGFLLKGFYGMLYECHFGSARCFLGFGFWDAVIYGFGVFLSLFISLRLQVAIALSFSGLGFRGFGA